MKAINLPSCPQALETADVCRTVPRLQALESGVVTLFGSPQTGKTVAAEYFTQTLAPSQQQTVFHHTYITEPASCSEAMASLSLGALGHSLKKTGRRTSQEEMAARLIESCKFFQRKYLLLDNAELLTRDALGALSRLPGFAQAFGWPLVVVFIGTDLLAKTIKQSPSIESRIEAWIQLGALSLPEFQGVLAQLHWHFATLDWKCQEHAAQATYLHRITEGKIGLVTRFLRHLDFRQNQKPTPIDVYYLESVHRKMMQESQLK